MTREGEVVANGWLGTGFSYDTCCRLGMADERTGRRDEVELIKERKIRDESRESSTEGNLRPEGEGPQCGEVLVVAARDVVAEAIEKEEAAKQKGKEADEL